MAHSQEVKATALAALIAGSSVAEVAKHHNLPIQTVDRWAKSGEMGEIGSEKKDLSERVQDYLDTLLTGLSAQVRHASTQDYIRKQSAADLALLHGVMADKAFRLLAAAATAARNGDSAG